MTIVRSGYRRHQRLKPLIDFALREGWKVARTPGGHLKLVKPGLTAIYTSAMAGDSRAGPNSISRLRRADRTAGTLATTTEAGADD